MIYLAICGVIFNLCLIGSITWIAVIAFRETPEKKVVDDLRKDKDGSTEK